MFGHEGDSIISLGLLIQLGSVPCFVIGSQLVPLGSLIRGQVFKLLRYSTHYFCLFRIGVLNSEITLLGYVVEEACVDWLLNFRVSCVLESFIHLLSHLSVAQLGQGLWWGCHVKLLGLILLGRRSLLGLSWRSACFLGRCHVVRDDSCGVEATLLVESGELPLHH